MIEILRATWMQSPISWIPQKIALFHSTTWSGSSSPRVFTAPSSTTTILRETGSKRLKSAGTRTYSYDPGTSRLIELEGVDPYVLTIDAAGNTRTMGDMALDYNGENRLIGVTQSGEPDIAYVYDALGRRVKKGVGDTETIYHYDPDGRLIAEHDPRHQPMDQLYLSRGGASWQWCATLRRMSRAVTGDCDGDSDVTISDYILFRNDYGRTDCSADEPCVGDLNGDGAVTFLDFNLFRNDYGRTSCPLKKYLLLP